MPKAEVAATGKRAQKDVEVGVVGEKDRNAILQGVSFRDKPIARGVMMKSVGGDVRRGIGLVVVIVQS
jgi:hypothetical protein